MKAIYLIGMPGSGKSTIGKVLAERMSMAFLDTDEEILKETGRTPEQIIEEEGEKSLRVYETDLLQRILHRTDLVVSTGGGLPVFEDNMAKMLQNAMTVYLKYSAEILWERLQNDRMRPLSKTFEEVSKLLEKREPIYRKASFTLEAGEGSDCREVLQSLMDLFHDDSSL